MRYANVDKVKRVVIVIVIVVVIALIVTVIVIVIVIAPCGKNPVAARDKGPQRPPYAAEAQHYAQISSKTGLVPPEYHLFPTRSSRLAALNPCP